MARDRTPIRDKVVPTRVCPVCAQSYTPRWEEQITCGGRCARVFGGHGCKRPKKGELPIAFAQFVEIRRATRKAEVEALCHKRWPELSVREIELFNFARRLGYDQGYQKGLLHVRKLKAKAS